MSEKDQGVAKVALVTKSRDDNGEKFPGNGLRFYCIEFHDNKESKAEDNLARAFLCLDFHFKVYTRDTLDLAL